MSKYLKINSPAIKHAKDLAADYDLSNHGLINLRNIYWNLPTPALYEEAVFRGEGHISHMGPFLVKTGKHTARAANDKFVVQEHSTKDRIWWGQYNRPMNDAKFNDLYMRVQSYLQGEDVFVQDCYAGADPDYQINVRIITEQAWHNLFARNMFITTTDPDKLKSHVPDFTIIQVPSYKADPRVEATNSNTAIVLNFEKRLGIICTSAYGGEIKKSIFTVLNFLLPFKGVLPMHCSANLGTKGDSALFFGLSGTGKTTLSADPERKLIGDDEHGWSDKGIFNFEGGCYAKVIRLSPEHEPQIYSCTKRFGTVLENVIMDDRSRHIDLDDDILTENTRAAYPLEYIDNALPEKMAGHPKNVIMLTCDASGVMPPIAKLTPDQALYHFISGYTSKIAGTEIGLGIEPQITFSACFGAPFMVHHPYEYANMLKDKIIKYNASCWIVNTGWTGGSFGIGKRISIKYTRALLNAALSGELLKVEYIKDPIFGFAVPQTCPNIPSNVLNPSSTWGDKNDYNKKYDALAARFIDNFKKYSSGCPEDVVKSGPIRRN